MKYYLDTNFLIYLVGEDERLKNKCIEFLEKNKGEYYISTLTILESLYVLQKVAEDDKIKEFLDLAKDFIILEFHFEDILEAVKIKELKTAL